MTDITLFPHIDTALRAIAVLALCVAPFLMPMPPSVDRVLRSLIEKVMRQRAAFRSD